MYDFSSKIHKNILSHINMSCYSSESTDMVYNSNNKEEGQSISKASIQPVEGPSTISNEATTVD